MEIVVLRLHHRITRDKRMSSHLALVARAFGAQKLVYSGEYDNRIEQTVTQIVESWGGNFGVEYTQNERQFVKQWKKDGGIVVHLTMFGIEIDDVVDEIRKVDKDILVIVGGAKVEIEFYHLADFNIAIGHQPHSEVAALAICLDKITNGKGRKRRYSDARVEIEPCKKGKKVIEKRRKE
ncbi:MAG: tRNA (cytidine(56)-2'-O)-methyltransferase [Candidatus Heimdallarchaeum endolithica]|uniref:tRNA (cytidine(56)-2'-O)-methyltransferase n=1 Tax=Candidatus Heimdallarchaeum endolithica TaxID=2876572 RepID=A0A9Y1BQG4_9ARCH|nr:MAG: tRNA (cytidine(56)-2'-O)-methyltransferase [Candidatus Heimdallarchaeum endolithica]